VIDCSELVDATSVAGPVLRITLRESRQPPTLVIVGRIDAATLGQFDTAVRYAAARYPRMVIDLTGAELAGRGGIRVLFLHRARVVAVLAAPGGAIARALGLAGYPTLVPAPVPARRRVPERALVLG
jgi:anti-anti-sigma regulatory factor